MRSNVVKCVYNSPSDRIVWQIASGKKDAEFRRKAVSDDPSAPEAETRTVPIEYLQNLDVFFRKYDLDDFDSTSPDGELNDIESVLIETEDESSFFLDGRAVPETVFPLFGELRNYFSRYWSETIVPIELSFSSFDGGGPSYSAETEIKGIITWYSKKVYHSPDHAELCGAGFDVFYTFYPLRPGKATVLITGDSPLGPVPAERLFAEVEDDFRMTYHVEDADQEEEA